MTFMHKLSCRLALLKDRMVAVSPALLAAAVVFACERPVQLTDTGSGTVAQLLVYPKSMTVRTGQTADFMAVALTSAGDPAAAAVTWSATSGSITDTSTKGGRHYGKYKAGPDTGRVKVIARGQGSNLSDTATVAVTLPPVASVSVSPASASVLLTQTVQLTATTLDSTGAVLTGRTVTWSSNNGAVATVSGSGVVTGSAVGTATITATSEGKSGSATITVSTVSVATVTSGGLVTGVAAGTATMTATSEGKSGTSAITVTFVPVSTVTVTPASANLAVGQTVQLTATPKDANGNTLTGRTITWATSNASVATVTTSGSVKGVTAGSATITATSEGQSGSSAISVRIVPVATVAVSPASASVQVGGTVQLTAVTKDSAGNTLTGRTITWASSNSTVATVSTTGLVSGLLIGSATITATSEAKSGSSAITVTAPAVHAGYYAATNGSSS